MSVRSDWVLTQLQDGDELGSFPGNPVPFDHDLASLYGVSARQIVEGNGVSFDSDSINAWVLATGGRVLSNGEPVISGNSAFLLPPGGPRAPAGGDGGVQRRGGGGGWLLFASLAGSGAWWLWKNRKRWMHA